MSHNSQAGLCKTSTSLYMSNSDVPVFRHKEQLPNHTSEIKKKAARHGSRCKDHNAAGALCSCMGTSFPIPPKIEFLSFIVLTGTSSYYLRRAPIASTDSNYIPCRNTRDPDWLPSHPGIRPSSSPEATCTNKPTNGTRDTVCVSQASFFWSGVYSRHLGEAMDPLTALDH
jgi:hypothetical protein